MEIYKKESSLCSRIKYILYSKPPPSRLFKITKLIEVYESRFINELGGQNLTPIAAKSSDKTFDDLDLQSNDISRQDIFDVIENELTDISILKEYGIMIPPEHMAQDKTDEEDKKST